MRACVCVRGCVCVCTHVCVDACACASECECICARKRSEGETKLLVQHVPSEEGFAMLPDDLQSDCLVQNNLIKFQFGKKLLNILSAR